MDFVHIGLLSPNPRVHTKKGEKISPEKNRPKPSRDRRSSLFHGWRGPFSPKSKMLRSWRANGAFSNMHRPAPGPKCVDLAGVPEACGNRSKNVGSKLIFEFGR